MDQVEGEDEHVLAFHSRTFYLFSPRFLTLIFFHIWTKINKFCLLKKCFKIFIFIFHHFLYLHSRWSCFTLKWSQSLLIDNPRTAWQYFHWTVFWEPISKTGSRCSETWHRSQDADFFYSVLEIPGGSDRPALSTGTRSQAGDDFSRRHQRLHQGPTNRVQSPHLIGCLGS